MTPTPVPTIAELKPRKYTSKQIGSKETEQIVALNNGGYYSHEIADVTGRTKEQIETCLWNEGYAARSHKYEQSEIETWISMYTGEFDGLPMSFAEVARKTGYCATTIQIGCLRRGLRDRHPGESQRLAHARRKAMRKH